MCKHIQFLEPADCAGCRRDAEKTRALIRIRNHLRRLHKHGWRAPKTHQVDEFGAYLVRRLKNGRMVALLLDHDGRLSVSGS